MDQNSSRRKARCMEITQLDSIKTDLPICTLWCGKLNTTCGHGYNYHQSVRYDYGVILAVVLPIRDYACGLTPIKHVE